MLKRILFLIFILLVNLFVANSADIEIKTYINQNYTTFIYNFNFSEGEKYSSFSIEKPKSSQIISSKSSSGENLKYSSAGDFFIFRPDQNLEDNNFIVEFKSEETSKNIVESGSFSTYLNFNFPVENLKFQLYPSEKYKEVLEIFPRNYELIENSYYEWNMENLNKDTLFLVSFNLEKNNENPRIYGVFLFLTLMIFVILFLILIIFVKKFFNQEKNNITKEKKQLKENSKNKTPKKKKEQTKTKEQIQNNKTSKNENISNNENTLNQENSNQNKTIIENQNQNPDPIEEIKEKYLTENEKQVLDVVKDNQGISQNDILNFLPKLTKSNLSKIISKLHSKKILNRIKVGKINKIHLGEKLEKKEE